MDELTYEIGKVTFWSDCQMTLQYIKNETKHVANHVAEMCEVTLPDHCRPCPGKAYPAVDASYDLSHQKLSLMNIGSGEDLISFSQVQEMKKVLDSSSEVPVAISVHPVSVRTHHTDNYTDDCSKTSNTPEDCQQTWPPVMITRLFNHGSSK